MLKNLILNYKLQSFTKQINVKKFTNEKLKKQQEILQRIDQEQEDDSMVKI